MISPKELDALLKVARKHNVATLKLEGLEVSLLPNEDQSAPLSSPATSSELPAEPSEEDLLFYSSGPSL